MSAAQQGGNPMKQATVKGTPAMNSDTMIDRPPANARANPGSENADDYGKIICHLNDDWRVIECTAGIQWILQRRRASLERAGGRWASVAYHRSRETLKIAVARRGGEADPDKAEIIDSLPAFIGGAS